jgi:quercetin dioxygenase-like cupin family protein
MIIDKPWGYEHIWAKTDKYVGKLIHINPNSRLSLQYHNEKQETIYVLKGKLSLDLEGASIFLLPGDTYHIPTGLVHRFGALDEEVELMEVSTTELDDVVRIQDDYKRLSTTP